MEVKEINKAYLGGVTEKIEILGIKWVFYKGIDPFENLGNPKLCFHVRLKDGSEDYIQIYGNTNYPISCKEHNKANKILGVH